jgi:hypothetical protein
MASDSSPVMDDQDGFYFAQDDVGPMMDPDDAVPLRRDLKYVPTCII